MFCYMKYLVGLLTTGVSLRIARSIGEIASAEGVAHVLRDAFERWLMGTAGMGTEPCHRHAAPGAVSIPSAARTYLAAAEFPSQDYWYLL